MSRLIVKSLPKNVTEDKLRALFSQKGTITDVQLKYTKEGLFRQFAFIGFQNEEQAQAALKYFNNSCIQTTRIKVELCAPLGSQEKPQSWSKYSKDSSAFRKQNGIEEQEPEKRETTKPERKAQKKDLVAEIIGEHKNDPDFIEFMQAHTRSRILWDNDAVLAEKTTEEVHPAKAEKEKTKASSEKKDSRAAVEVEKEAKEPEEEIEEPKLAEKEISDLEYMKSLMKKSSTSETPTTTDKPTKEPAKAKQDTIDLFTIKIQGIPFNSKRQDILKFFKPLKPYSVRLPAKDHGFCFVGFKTEKDFNRAMVKNKSFVKGKQVFFSDFTEQNKIMKNKTGQGDDSASFEQQTNVKWQKQEDAVRKEEDICESGRIFFRNLAYTVTEDEMQAVFEKYGPIAEVNLPIDPLTRQIKGFGTVTFVMPEHAVRAFSELDGTLFHGRLLHLITAKSKDNADGEEKGDGLGFKAKKAQKLKQSAGQSHNWNTLFLGPNAVADILARRFETSKETILDTKAGGSSAAVRLALGETQIVIEMKRFLEENDVRLDVFENAPTKRSKTVLLAKNLPAGTTVAELQPLFAKFGLIGRIVLPPSGVTALIEFLDPSEARSAFKKLAYSKFKTLPLYLEWAPENTFKTSVDGEAIKLAEAEKESTKTDDKIQVVNDVEQSKPEEPPAVENAADDVDDEPEPETTLFLRNLNFRTREDAIRQHFKQQGTIHIVQVAMRKDSENPSMKVSLGYGFIQFKKRSVTEKVLKTMQFTQIEGNQVELKRSDRTLKSADQPQRKQTKSTKQTGTKILVRNVPFQAKTNEVRDIFKAFGELKSVRLPKKMTPGEDEHRGFGFVDFVTKSDAKKAFDALSQSTHLYGRRLVLEWAASDDENVDELRKRTAQNFHGYDRAAKVNRKSIFDSSTIGDVREEDGER